MARQDVSLGSTFVSVRDKKIDKLNYRRVRGTAAEIAVGVHKFILIFDPQFCSSAVSGQRHSERERKPRRVIPQCSESRS